MPEQRLDARAPFLHLAETCVQSARTLAVPHELTGTLLRETKGEMVLGSRLRAALVRLNPALPPEAITAAVDELTRDRSATSLEAANREVYLLLKEGIKVSLPESDSTPHPGPLPGRGGEGVKPRPESLSSAPRPSPGLRPASPAPASEGHGRGGEGKGGQQTVRIRVMDWEQPANDANSELRISIVEPSEFRTTSFDCRTD